MSQYYYRFYDRHWADDIEVRIICAQLPVLRETKSTVVINYFGTEKRVLKNARRRFAYPTVELALDSYRQRKSWQARRLKYRLDLADEAHAKALAMEKGLTALPTPKLGDYHLTSVLPGSPETDVDPERRLYGNQLRSGPHGL